jgi:Holliday junction resolvase RusA-like endonuclease
VSVDVPAALYRLSISGEPQPKQRPRVVADGKRTYTPKATVQAEQKLAWCFRQSYPGVEVDADHLWGIRAVFFMKTRRRTDWDNLGKLCSDALIGVLYQDDSQVTEAHILVIRGASQPRTQIEIFRVKPEWN